MEHSPTFGWCFIGSGSITRRVMRDLSRYSKTSYLATVYSPNPSHARSLADQYGAKACSTPEEAILDGSVSGVYVATPHIHHLEYAKMALQLGKPVLCEKPMTPNAKLTGELIRAAREAGLYLAEAMWTRYNRLPRRRYHSRVGHADHHGEELLNNQRQHQPRQVFSRKKQPGFLR